MQQSGKLDYEKKLGRRNKLDYEKKIWGEEKKYKNRLKILKVLI